MVMGSFKLSEDRSQKATIGCGSLIVIALVVAIFTRGGSQQLEQELGGLRSEMAELKGAIGEQTKEIRKLQELLKKRDSPVNVEKAEPGR
jgi:hypothetical protein